MRTPSALQQREKTTTTELSISCESCTRQDTTACEDCVVSFLLGPPERHEEAVIVDVLEARAIRMLHDAGLLPDLRFQRRVS
jgi:hypothetical protein